MVFDACFSGSLFESKGTTEPPSTNFLDISKMLGLSIRFYITAGRVNERVSADSAFAKLLLRGLRGEADTFHEGFFSAVDLGTYLLHVVPKCRDQTPQFGSIAFEPLSEGQFFFLTEPAAADKGAPLARAPTDMTPTGRIN